MPNNFGQVLIADDDPLTRAAYKSALQRAGYTVLLASDGEGLWRLRTPRLPIAVNGAGDLMTALFFFHWLRTRSAPEALASAGASVYGVVAATAEAGERELAIVAAQDEFVHPRRLFRPEPL